MKEVTTIGLDIGKSVFQVHGIDGSGKVVVRRQLKRSQLLAFFKKLGPCLVGMEACATAHHWARAISALGHEVRLMPPRYVKPYVKKQGKNDAVDAEAICEAVGRANMRFVAVKSPEQQAVLMEHGTRQLLVRQRTALVNALRAHLAEFGIVAPVGRKGLARLLAVVEREEDARIPASARGCLLALRDQLALVEAQILAADRRILAWHRASELSRRLDDIPGIGPVIASALVASVGDPHAFASGRDLAAWIGLVPRQHSTGGKTRLGRITKAGNRYLRRLLVVGALSVIRRAKQKGGRRRPWLDALLQRRSEKVAAVALANKNARIAWALMTQGTCYQEPQAMAPAEAR